MPIRITLDKVMLDRELTLTEVADRVGLTLANLSVLKTGRGRAVRFSTLEALCDTLDCQPGDLLRFTRKPRPVVPAIEPEPDATGG